MKSLRLLFLIACYPLPLSLLAQNNNPGVYKTGNDFTKNILSYSKQEGRKYKFHLHETFNTSHLKIVLGDTTIKLNKDSIFGYRDAQNKSYRFYHKSVYEILNTTQHILIYSQNSMSGGKGNQTITNYFFSVNTEGPPLPLSKQNLKNSFSKESEFLDLLDLYFSDDKDLHSYDSSRKMCKLNHVFQISQQQTIKNK